MAWFLVVDFGLFKYLVLPISVDFSERLWAEVGVAWRRQPRAPALVDYFRGDSFITSLINFFSSF